MARSEKTFRNRRIWGLIFIATLAIFSIFSNPDFWQKGENSKAEISQSANISEAREALEKLEVKEGRAPKTGYSREQFGKGWTKNSDGCDTRNRILKRDLTETTENAKCQILTGVLNDPYTGEKIQFARGENSSAVQIDHVVALSDAWQKGAQNLSPEKRTELANDPLNLLAVDGSANQQKSDSDAASWLPANKSFRCEYVSRQVLVKRKYSLWLTQAEKSTIQAIFEKC